MPAGSSFSWNTQGPVDFAHFYFDRKTVDQVVAQAFDRDPAHVSLREGLGADDDLIRSLTRAILDELSADPQQAYVDDLVRLLLCRTLRLHSDVREAVVRTRYALAPFRLRRAADFIEANIGTAIGVGDIADASGVSRFHFSRAFRETTGKAPYAYLLERRLAAAKALLIGGDLSLTVISHRCGFASLSQFSRAVNRGVGVAPSTDRERQ